MVTSEHALPAFLMILHNDWMHEQLQCRESMRADKELLLPHLPRLHRWGKITNGKLQSTWLTASGKTLSSWKRMLRSH